MAHSITSCISHLWNRIPAFPEISRDKASSAAQAALKQLPWIVGTAVGFHLGSMAMIIIVVGSGLGVLAFVYSELEPEEKTKKLLFICKITLAAFAILQFTIAVNYTAQLFKDAVRSPTHFLTWSSMLQNGFVAKGAFKAGFSAKTKYESLDEIRENSYESFESLKTLGLPLIILFSLFPNIKKDPRYIEDLKKKYVSPFTDEEITPVKAKDLPSLQQFFNKYEQLEKLINSIVREDDEDRMKLNEDELKRQHQTISSSLDHLGESFNNLIQVHINQLNEIDRISIDTALDEIGFTVGDYRCNFSSRQTLLSKLYARGIYCLGDLKRENIVGSIEKEEVIKRINDYLDGKTLEPIENKSLPTHSKVKKIATAFFNIGLTGATLAAQFAFAPTLTGVGVAFGFFQEGEGMNELQSFRLSQADLFFPTPLLQKCCEIKDRLFNMLIALNTPPTGFASNLALFAGINQGETLRAYFNHIFNKY